MPTLRPEEHCAQLLAPFSPLGHVQPLLRPLDLRTGEVEAYSMLEAMAPRIAVLPPAPLRSLERVRAAPVRRLAPSATLLLQSPAKSPFLPAKRVP